MPEVLVAAVEPAGINAHQPFHPGHQVGLGRLHHQMKMIAHEAKRMNLPAGFLARFGQGVEEEFSIGNVGENGLKVIAAVHEAPEYCTRSLPGIEPTLFELALLAMCYYVCAIPQQPLRW